MNDASLKFKEVQKLEFKEARELLGLNEERRDYRVEELEQKKRGKKGQKQYDLTEDNCQFMRVYFDEREDSKYSLSNHLVVKLVHTIIFDKSLKIENRRLFMAHHRQHGNYNSETSLCVQALNPRCTEDEIIEELNLILRDDRLAR